MLDGPQRTSFIHFIVFSADTAWFSQVQGCRSSDVHSVSECSWRLSSCLCININCQLHHSVFGALSTFTCRDHRVCWQFWVSGMLCTYVGHGNLQQRLKSVPSGRYHFPKLMLGNRRCPPDPLQLGRKCSVVPELPKCVSQGTWGCWHRVASLF